jgi:hypothetical protein
MGGAVAELWEMTGVGLEPTTCGLKGHELAPASASEHQIMRILGGATLTSASQRWWALSPEPPLTPKLCKPV